MTAPPKPTIQQLSRDELHRLYAHYGGLTIDREDLLESFDGRRQAANGAKQLEALRQLAHLDMMDVLKESERHLEESGRQTKQMTRLTWAIAIMTLANVVAVLVSLCR